MTGKSFVRVDPEQKTALRIEGAATLSAIAGRAETAALTAEAAADRAQAARRLPSAPPGPPPISCVPDLATAGIPTDGSDAAPAINAALARDGTVVLEAGASYHLGSAVMRPSHSRLIARDGPPARLIALADFQGGRDNLFNALVTNEPGVHDLSVRNILVDGRGVGLGNVDTRINGFKELAATRVRHELTMSQNTSGYGHFVQPHATRARDILYERCGTRGCEYGFEQMGADNVYALDCWAEDSDGPVPASAWIHAVSGSRGIIFIGFRASGRVTNGISILHNEAKVQDDIQFIDCDLDVRGGKAFITEGDARTNNLSIIGGRLRGEQGSIAIRTALHVTDGASLEAVSAGTVVALSLYDSELLLDDGGRIFVQTTAPGSAGFGVSLDPTSRAHIAGQVRGVTPVYYPLSGPGLRNVDYIVEAAQLVDRASIDINAQVTTVAVTHLGAPVRFVATSAQVYRVEADNANLTLPTGSRIRLQRLGGPVTIEAGAGVTLAAPNGAALALGGEAILTKLAGPSSWALQLVGDVATPTPAPTPTPTSTPTPTPTPAPSLGESVPLQFFGTKGTLSSLDSEGFYTVTTEAVSGNRAVGSSAALSGDILVEIVPLADPPSLFVNFDDVIAFAARSYGETLESIQTEGGGGGPTWLGAFRQGTYQGPLAPRVGRFYMSRRGSAWRIYTGNSWAEAFAAGPIHNSTAVDTQPRFLAITEIGNNARFKVRFVPLPTA